MMADNDELQDAILAETVSEDVTKVTEEKENQESNDKEDQNEDDDVVEDVSDAKDCNMDENDNDDVKDVQDIVDESVKNSVEATEQDDDVIVEADLKGEDEEEAEIDDEEDEEVAKIMATADEDDEVKEISEKNSGSDSPEVVSISSAESQGKKKQPPDVVELSDDEEEQVSVENTGESSSEDEGDPSRDPGVDATRTIPPDFLLPFLHGWKREVVQRPPKGNSVSQFDVYYIPPQDTKHRTREAKRKRRSKTDQERFFDDFPSKILSVANFNYVRKPLGLNNAAYEIIRKSNIRESKEPSPSDVRRGGKSNGKGKGKYKEVEESAGLLEDDSDDGENEVNYREGFDVDLPLCAQINRNTLGMRLEHKKRRKYRDPETCCTPPMAEDMLWPQLDEDPLGVYTDLGGRSSPSTPPPLRAVKLTPIANAERIAKAFEKVREEVEKNPSVKEQELKEDLASHDAKIKQFKNYVEPKQSSLLRQGMSDKLKFLSGISFSQTRSPGIQRSMQRPGMSNSQMSLNKRASQLLQQGQQQGNRGLLLSGNMVKVKLPMKSINGKRPVVELVMEQNGRYQPIKFSNNMQVTESIPKVLFEQANALRKAVYQKATQVPRVGSKQLYLAINPSAGGMLALFGPGRQSNGQQSRLQQPNSQLRANPTARPGGGAPSQPGSDQVAILVKPLRGNNLKPVLLNVPRKVAVKVKPGTTLSFSASNDQKYTVLDSKIHPPVGGGRKNGSNGAAGRGPMNQQGRVNNSAMPAVRRTVGAGGGILPHLPSSVSIRPVNRSAINPPAGRSGVLPRRGMPSVQRGPVRRPPPSVLQGASAAKSRKVLSTGEM